MLESLITSKTRLKLLLKFFLNPGTRAYLREISAEFGESSNAIRVELNRLSKAKLLKSEPAGRTIQYQANTEHPMFGDIENIVKKYIGLDKLVEHLFSELGGVERAFITGDYAKGIDSGLIDLVLVGDVDSEVLERLANKTELLIKRKIRVLVLRVDEYETLESRLLKDRILLLWVNDIEAKIQPITKL
ncbi:MAG: ArsR family transcriptional regulator [Candidatus Marinimicrobia bacterium]|nr:ArsR family transcriptional regulator [Candidatus Neomarinimicrobiota bacterium]